jgi:hypothetical protein
METSWKIGYGPKGYAFAIKRDDNSDVCVLHNGLTPQDKALATLISATPDLLAAAEFAVDVLLKNSYANAQADAYRKLVDAIAKAKGDNNA